MTRFYRRDGRYFVRTDGPDGRLAEFAVAYVFGVTPLEQYLLELPGGRLQALGSRLGQPAEASRAASASSTSTRARRSTTGDVLHWTKPSQNWNTQCAECHSTNLRKGYDLAERPLPTTFSEINVACEACHGPGSRHVEWAQAAPRAAASRSGTRGSWCASTSAATAPGTMDEARGTRRLAGVSDRRIEVETCGRCHARRGLLTRGLPARAGCSPRRTGRRCSSEGLYYADGQMRDEVYNWGSFLQSRMYAAGVTCADCHDPHDARLRAGARRGVRRVPHAGDVRDAPPPLPPREAARAPPASPATCGARPTWSWTSGTITRSACPRPDLTVALGRENAPNACNDCHRDRRPRGPRARCAAPTPADASTKPHYATALQAGRRTGRAPERRCSAVVRDPALPGIVRGTAVSLLPPHMGPESLPALEAARQATPTRWCDWEPRAPLAALPPRERVQDRRAPAVGSGARGPGGGRASFADVPDAELESEARAAFDRALDEYRLAQRANAERPEAHVNLGIVNQKRGNPAAARRNYDQALALAPWFVPAWVNLADLLRTEGREDEAAAALRRALEVDPLSAPAHHAYGLLLVRQKRTPEALSELRRAAELAPGAPDFAYTYAIGLHSSARTDEALAVLRQANARNPGARSVLVALVTINRERGALREARRYAAQLVAAAPGDPAARQLLASLGQD